MEGRTKAIIGGYTFHNEFTVMERNDSIVTNSHYLLNIFFTDCPVANSIQLHCTVRMKGRDCYALHIMKKKLSDKRWVKLNTTQFPISHVMYFEVDDWQKGLA